MTQFPGAAWHMRMWRITVIPGSRVVRSTPHHPAHRTGGMHGGPPSTGEEGGPPSCAGNEGRLPLKSETAARSLLPRPDRDRSPGATPRGRRTGTIRYVTTTQPLPAVSSPARWAVRAAHVIPLLTLPSGIWRLLLADGHHAVYTDAGYKALGTTGWGAVYVVALSLAGEALALLSLGLVRPWGETLPHRVPLLGGRRVPWQAAVVPAGLGAVALTVLWSSFALWWAIPHDDMTPAGSVVAGFLYLPLVAWGPLLGAVTVSTYRRRRRAEGGCR